MFLFLILWPEKKLLSTVDASVSHSLCNCYNFGSSHLHRQIPIDELHGRSSAGLNECKIESAKTKIIEITWRAHYNFRSRDPFDCEWQRKNNYTAQNCDFHPIFRVSHLLIVHREQEREREGAQFHLTRKSAIISLDFLSQKQCATLIFASETFVCVKFVCAFFSFHFRRAFRLRFSMWNISLDEIDLCATLIFFSLFLFIKYVEHVFWKTFNR